MSSSSVVSGARLGELPAPKGAVRRPKRRGFGESSGHGKTSGKGHKGQRARSGPGLRPEFEGGQMPLVRRIPKRGFTHVRLIPIQAVNLLSLNRFESGSIIDPPVLAQAGLIRSHRVLVKILAEGTLTNALTIRAHQFSKAALSKIASAGGTAEVLASSKPLVQGK